MFVVREPAYTARRRAAAQQENAEQIYRLPLDAYETEDSIVLTASVPGMHADDLSITLDDDVLVIRGELNGLEAETNYLLRERFHGKFERRLSVNVPVKIESAEATFDNGVLKLVLPKAEEAKPIRINVKTSNN